MTTYEQRERLAQLKKYFLRFFLPVLVAGGIISFAMGHQAVVTMLYKVCLVVVFYALAELIWAVGYRAWFKDLVKRDPRAVLTMRGLLYAAIILAGTLGL